MRLAITASHSAHSALMLVGALSRLGIELGLWCCRDCGLRERYELDCNDRGLCRAHGDGAAAVATTVAAVVVVVHGVAALDGVRTLHRVGALHGVALAGAREHYGSGG